MATIRQLQASRGINPDIPENDPFLALNERYQSPYQEILSRHAQERANIDSESSLRPPPPEESIADKRVRLSFMTPAERAEGGANIARKVPEPQKHYYATNIGDTAAQWQSEGKNPTMIAETPEDESRAKGAGIKDVRRSTTYKVPKAPTEEDLISDKITDGMWGQWLKSEGFDEDPRKVNPTMVAIEARKKFESTYPKPRLGTKEYEQWEKDAKAAQTDAFNEAKDSRDYARAEFKEVRTFAKDQKNIQAAKEAEAQKAAKAQEAAQADALKQKIAILNDWQNYYLSPDQEAKIADPNRKGKIVLHPGTHLKPHVLNGLNKILENAGMPRLTMREVTVPGKKGEPVKKEAIGYWDESGGGGGGGGGTSPLVGKPAGRYRVDGKVIKWDGAKEVR